MKRFQRVPTVLTMVKSIIANQRSGVRELKRAHLSQLTQQKI